MLRVQVSVLQQGSANISIGELSVATAGATTATDNFRIVGFKDVEGIDYAAAGVIALVKLNLPFHVATTGI